MSKNKKSKETKYYLPLNLPPFKTSDIQSSKDKKDFGGILKDTGKSMLNAMLTPLEIASGQNFYDPKMDTNLGVAGAKVANNIQGIGEQIAPTALNMVAPGMGTALSAAQTIGGMTNIDNTQERHQVDPRLQSGLSGLMGAATSIAPMFMQDGGTVGGEDPVYKEQMRIYELANKWNKTLDRSKGNYGAASQYANQFYSSPEGNELNQLLTKNNVRSIDDPNRMIKAPTDGGINYNYANYPMPVAQTPTPAPIIMDNKIAPVQPFTYKKEFTGFTDNTFPASMTTDEYSKGKLTMNYGGPLDMTHFKGNTHEEGGIPLGQNTEVEDGETRVGDYIFSDSLTPEKSKLTFADLSKRIDSKYKLRPNDPASNRTKQKELEALMTANEIARQAKQEMEDEIVAEDFAKYGGYIKCKDGGMFIDPTKRSGFIKTAKSRGYSIMDYADRIMKYGGKMKKADGGLEEVNYPEAGLPLDAFGNPLTLFAQPQLMNFQDTQGIPSLATQGINPNLYSNAPEERQYDFFDPNNKFGAKEVGLMASNLAGIYNIAKGQDSKTTKFERMDAEEVDLSAQRTAAEKQAQMAKNANRYNIRGNATSSGQALANMTVGNSAITDSLQDVLMQSYLNEQNANVGIRNQANQFNTQIANNEIIANEQNQAMADSLIGAGLADIGTNTGLYMRDKGLQRENNNSNKRTMDALNLLVQNYKLGSNPEMDKFYIEYLLPKTKQS